MTLTDFLLARIAEDEARAGETHLFDCVLDHVDGRDGCSCVVPARVLADCEAKRVLVWRHMNRDRFTLGILAEVYSEHPDYRAEWKP